MNRPRKSGDAPSHQQLQASRFRRALLRWYDIHKRALPWRGEKDPYKIWVAEIMLQQTRVAVVADRYRRFLVRFPTVGALAASRVSSVLAEWSGLGYYRRARAMHAAASLIVREHEGKLPQSPEKLCCLPGIGRYTAAAIASIAHKEAVPVVDGNVERVLLRVYGEGSIRTQEDCWQRAGQLLHRKRPGDFNQALMELGATVCLPGTPLCSECPLKRLCRARRQFNGSRGRPRSEPAARRKKIRAGYRVLLHDNCVCLVQRPADAALMPSMWELPSGNGKAARSALSIRLRHSITNTDFEIVARLEPQSKKSRAAEASAKWVNVRGLEQLPLTGLTRKILRGFSLLD